MRFVAFLKLIRWKNLLLLIYVQLLIKFLVFPSFDITTNLSIIQFTILLFSTLLITAAGYIINDIYDIEADIINKPNKVIIPKNFSIPNARQLYLVFNTSGLVLGIGLSLHIQKPTYAFVFIGTSLLLYYYSKTLKSKPLIGNLSISFLISVSILLLWMFDMNRSIQNQSLGLINNVLILLSIFAFLLNLIREILKDIEDVDGDHKQHMKTLPILLGKDRTKKMIAFLCLAPITVLLYISINYIEIYKFTVLYLLIFSLIPLLYISLKLFSIKSKKELKRMSSLLKIIMFLGINSLIVFSLYQ